MNKKHKGYKKLLQTYDQPDRPAPKGLYWAVCAICKRFFLRNVTKRPNTYFLPCCASCREINASKDNQDQAKRDEKGRRI